MCAHRCNGGVMKTQLFFFSGTGNSYAIARKIKEQLPGDVEIVGLQAVRESRHVEAERVGFIVPVYFVTLPAIVHAAVKNMTFRKDAFIFAVVNCGLNAGNALVDFRNILKKRGAGLSYGKVMFMPDNSIAFSTNERKKQLMLKRVDDDVVRIGNAVKDGEVNTDRLSVNPVWRFGGKVVEFGLLRMLGAEKKSAGAKCTGCGKCTTFCPVNNIIFHQGRPEFGNNCEQCFSCAHRCPAMAIEYGRVKVTPKNRWVHPEVTMEELSRYN